MWVITSKFSAYHLSYVEESAAWSTLTVAPLLHIEPHCWLGLGVCHFISQYSDRALPLSQSSSCRVVCGHYFPFFICLPISGERTRQPNSLGWNNAIKGNQVCHVILRHGQSLQRAGRYLHPNITVGRGGRLPPSELIFSLCPF